MLATGIKTPVGIKIGGPDLDVLERLGKEIEATVRPLPGTLSAYAARVPRIKKFKCCPTRVVRASCRGLGR